MSMCATAGCNLEVDDGAICWNCTRQLGFNLKAIASLWPDVQDAIGSQLRLATGGRRATRNPGIEYNSDAAQVAHDVLTHLFRLADNSTTWHNVPDLAKHLAGQTKRLRLTQWPAIIFAADREAMERVVDQPPARIALGECGKPRVVGDTLIRCSALIYADKGAAGSVNCPVCEWPHDVKDLLRQREREARNRHATAAEIAQFATQPRISDDGCETRLSYTVEQLTKRISKFVERGRLLVIAHDKHGRPEYRIGDALALLEESEQRKRAS